MSTPENLVIVEEPSRYVIRLPGLPEEAEMTFRRSGHIVTITHTGVPREMEGKGIGSALMKHMIAQARANSWKIVPACSFAMVQFERHPEWKDLLA